MNIQGIIQPDTSGAVGPPTWSSRFLDWVKRRRNFLIVVIAPTLILASYLYLVASDQYETEADFIVNAGGDRAGIPTSGISTLLGMSGALSGAQGQVLSVVDYLQSHDAVTSLREKIDLVSIFRAPGTDVMSRMWTADPTPETLLRFYRGKVTVHYDRDTGITKLKVRTFRPADSYRVAESLLRLGEARVNEMNRKSYRDAVTMARQELAEAEDAASDVQRQITAYRQSGRDIDPAGSGAAQIKLVSDLRGGLAAAQAQLESMGSMISHSSPQYIAMSRHVASLRRALAAQSAALAGTGQTVASNLGGYENLKVRQDFASKRYEAAAATLERAEQDAQKQQLYLVRVVSPNQPVKALYPERAKIVLTVLIALMLAYGIGWLIAAGVKEHAA